MSSYCFGCADSGPVKGDHMHQYITITGQARWCWWIDGHAFGFIAKALDYIMGTLDCDIKDAMLYIKTLPKIYG